MSKSCRIVDCRDVSEGARDWGSHLPRVQKRLLATIEERRKEDATKAEVPTAKEAGAARLHNRNLKTRRRMCRRQGKAIDGSVWNSSIPHAQACGFFVRSSNDSNSESQYALKGVSVDGEIHRSRGLGYPPSAPCAELPDGGQGNAARPIPWRFGLEQTPTLDANYYYSVKELAHLWNMSSESIRRLFVHEPGTLIFRMQKTGRRTYRTIRIPGTVALRVQNRMTVVS